jgi:hypothetical protein
MSGDKGGWQRGMSGERERGRKERSRIEQECEKKMTGR